MSRPVELTEQEVLACLARSRQPRSVREMAETLHLRHVARRALKKIIARLQRKGEIEEIRTGRFRLAGAKGAAPAPPPVLAGAGKRPRTEPGPVAQEKKDPHLLIGRLMAHRDGYGFVVPDEPRADLEGDLFIGRDNLGDAMHGDRVLARIERRGQSGAAGRAEGRVVRVLGRAHPTVVGLFRYGPRGNSVLPYEPRIRHEIIIPPGEELTPELRPKLGHGAAGRRGVRLPELDGAVVNVELTRYPRLGAAPAGRVVEILGKPGEFGVDVEIIIRKHHLPYQFPEEVLAEARGVARAPAARDLVGRRDFRHLPIVTIDGETAKDFDDAVYVARRGEDRWALQVHIADVAHYVARGAALDPEARVRGTSVYFPDRAVPMLPEALSNDICSLNPGVDRLVMSVLMEVDTQGNIVKAEFAPGVIRSAARMTYTSVNKVLEGDSEAAARYAHLAENFRLMRELALILNARRARLGSIDFDLPEPVIEFDELGRMVRIVRSERNIAHRIIEEFMLAANQAVAAYLNRRGIASLHRAHEKPDPKKVLEFEEIARTFGYSLGVADLAERRVVVKHGRAPASLREARPGRPGRHARGREREMSVTLPGSLELDIRPQHYQRLTEKIAGKPEERILSYLMLRSLKQARYAAEPLGHFALAFDHYTHFTSPIRRYPDLIVHRILKWALEHPDSRLRAEALGARVAAASAAAKLTGKKSAGGAAPEAEHGLYRRVELEEIADESSEAERRADAAERELMEWKTTQFMESHLGEEYDALIISVQKFGFFVELVEILVEGLVPLNALEELTGQRCSYREGDHAIVAQRGRPGSAGKGWVWRLGQPIRVRADRVDPVLRRVEFSPVFSRD